jgi:hypothetical protein
MAARPRPRQRTIGIGIEQTYGTYAVPTIWVPGEVDIKSKPGVKEADMPIGELDEARLELDDPLIDGTMKLECAPGCMEEILSLLTPITGEVVLYGSLTVVEGLGNGEWRVNMGVVAKKFSLAMTKTERAMADLDVVCQQRRDSAAIQGFTAPTPDYGDMVAPYIYKEFKSLLGTNAEDHIQSCKLEIDHQLAEGDYISDGAGLRAHPPSNGRKITLTLDHLYEHKDHYTSAMSGGELAWNLSCQRGTDQLAIALPRTRIMDGVDPDRTNTMQPLQMKALRPFTNGVGGDIYTISEGTVGGS